MAEKSLGKNLSWTTIGMVLYNFAIWVLSALILRICGADASGYYAVAMAIGNTIYAAALFGMRTVIVSDHSHRYSYEQYFGTRIVSVLFACLSLFVIVGVSHYDRIQNAVLIMYTLFKCAEALTEVLDCFMQVNLNMEINAKSMVLRSILYITGFSLVLVSTKNLVLGFAVLTVLALLVFAFYNLKRVRAQLHFKTPSFSKLLPILKQSLPIMIFELLASLIVAIPRLRYEQIGSLNALGIYASIYTMVIFLQLVINVLIYTLAPYMAKAHSEKDAKGFTKYLVILLSGAFGLGLLAALMTALLGYPVMGLLYGAEAAPYYTYLYLGIVSGVTMALTWIFSQLFVIYGQNYSQLICSVLSVISCYVLSQKLVVADDCNSMSLVLIFSNLIFVLSALCLLKFKKGEAA